MKGQDEGVAALLEKKTSAEWRVRTRSWFPRGGCNEVASSQKHSTLLRYIQRSYLHTKA